MTTDVLVIGGGPAGVAAAIQLARGGAQVTLFEREHAPTHKVCGEFLSGEALLYLQQLGIDVCALEAVPLHTVRLAGNAHTTESTLPFTAMSLTRRTLDSELLWIAEYSGVNVRRKCPVEHLARAGNAWQAALAGGETVHAAAVFLASGKHDIRGHARPAGKQRGMVAFKMYWRLGPSEALSLGNAVELVTYPGGYAGLQPVESGLANLCCLIHTDWLRQHKARWDHLLDHMCSESPHLRRRLCAAVPQLAHPLTIASIPYGFVRKASDGLWYLGDQAVVIPSFTGDGMSLALHSGMLAAEMYLRKTSAQHYQQTLAQQVMRQVTLATAVSKTIAQAPCLVRALPRLWPGILQVVAENTRISPGHRLH